jgi:Fe-S-cluster-containing hydrogenase component 2
MDGSKQERVQELKEDLWAGRISRRDFVRLMFALGVFASVPGLAVDKAAAAEGEAKAEHTIIVDPGKCTGCLSCALACAEKFMPEVDPEGAKQSINLEYARIRPMRFQYVDFVNVCQHCELIKWAEGADQHPCQAVCPTGALHTVQEGEGKEGYTGKGYLNVDRDKCLGLDACGRCLEICEEQFGSGVSFDPLEKKAQVCTRCGGDPACVQACPEGALEFIPVLVNGRYYAQNPDHAAELQYRKLYNQARDL